MSRVIGYLFSLVGILIVASGIKGINAIFSKFVPVLATINNMYLMIAGVILVVLGLIMLRSSNMYGGRQALEVPIYRGNRIVGYRRHR